MTYKVLLEPVGPVPEEALKFAQFIFDYALSNMNILPTPGMFVQGPAKEGEPAEALFVNRVGWRQEEGAHGARLVVVVESGKVTKPIDSAEVKGRVVEFVERMKKQLLTESQQVDALVKLFSGMMEGRRYVA